MEINKNKQLLLSKYLIDPLCSRLVFFIDLSTLSEAIFFANVVRGVCRGSFLSGRVHHFFLYSPPQFPHFLLSNNCQDVIGNVFNLRAVQNNCLDQILMFFFYFLQRCNIFATLSFCKFIRLLEPQSSYISQK